MDVARQTTGDDTKNFVSVAWNIPWEDKKTLLRNLGKTIVHGKGEKVWYCCPRCESQVWAYESFVNTPCWECMAGDKGKKIGYKSSDMVQRSGQSKFFNRLNKHDTMMDDGFLERPLTTLKYSNFLIVYDKFNKNYTKISEGQIIGMLDQIDTNRVEFIKFYEKTRKIGKSSIDDSKDEGSGNSTETVYTGKLAYKEKVHAKKYQIYKKVRYKIGDKGEETQNLKEYYQLIGVKNNKYGYDIGIECDSIPKKCIFLWSIESPIYHELTPIIESDDYQQLELYMPLIRSVNLYITNHPMVKQTTTYRGSHMNVRQAELLKLNRMYRISKYLATSEDIKVANKFKTKMNGDGFVVKFNIPKNCHNAAYVHQYSRYPDESEVLMPPYTVIKIIDIDLKEKSIECNVYDNKSQDQELEQIHL